MKRWVVKKNKNSKNILGTNYSIKPFTYGQMFEEMGCAVSGFINYQTKIIGYSNQTPSEIKPTLLHEYLHGLFYEAGFNVENEENLIEFIIRHMDKISSFYDSINVTVEDKGVSDE